VNDENDPSVDPATFSLGGWRLASSVWRDFRHGFFHLLGYDLLFKAAASAILVPLSTWVITTLISTSGDLSLSNDQIVAFALSPIGLVTLFIAATVVLAFGFTEQAGFVVMGTRALSSQRVSALEGGWLTVKRSPSILGLGALQVVLYSLALAPFVVLAGLAYVLLLGRYDINYVIAERTTTFWVAAIIAVALLAGAGLAFVRLYLRWIFSVAAAVLEGAGPVVALRTSRRLMEGEWTRVGGVFLGWGLIMVASPLAVTFLFDWAGEVLITWLGENLSMTLAVLALLTTLYLLAIGVASFVGIAVNGLLIAHLYHGLRAQKGFAATMMPQPGSIDDPEGRTRRRSRLRVAAVVAVLLVAGTALSFAALADLSLDDEVYVIAHRGSSTGAPENSLSAIEKAIEEGADYAEIDVQETADSVVVLLHDTDLMRIAGVDRKIGDLTYQETRELDAGSWFSPDFAGERIPTLEEAIEVARGRIGLQVELKFNGLDYELAERVVKIIEENGFAPQAQIVSLDYAGILQVRKLNRDLETGYIVFRAVGDISGLDVDFLSVNSWIATEDLVASIREAGKEIHVWTVNDRRRMYSLIDLGVDGILTDEPSVLRAVIEERSSLSDAEKTLLAFRNWLRR
jgi:glycerophosphoryl diester phosphodiesterase